MASPFGLDHLSVIRVLVLLNLAWRHGVRMQIQYNVAKAVGVLG